ncbi:hypothetical protein B0T22DRAFT_526338 [Podospora appendiculata]|uniref:G-protein coupled receptors family 2 profile 2 domain-containing protein n=1 Tax=Podospora appendiculata TaxID=314037 RepID=A0AAE1CHE0_9PEZI|nr:hypothetical protein B0T22DRAFT_526338 [Podospora appendiculata]
MALAGTQRDTIQHVERLGASLSLVGVFLIFITYALFKRLRTVPNTFILFASIANVGASVACLIGYAGILAGDPSPLCRVQAFLLEMFMQSDPWWSFAMAVNVYMVFFMAASPDYFRQYLWVYCLICFGLPALPAIICLVYAPSNVNIYGNATLWCWIADAYNSLRIFTYYVPIWACIVLSGVIYVAVGYHVFHQRNQLRNLTLSTPKDISGADLRYSAEKIMSDRAPAPAAANPTSTQPQYYGTVTTDIQVTAECSDSQTPPSTPAPSIAPVLPTLQPSTSLHPWASCSDDITVCSPTQCTPTIPFTATATGMPAISSVKTRTKKKKKKRVSFNRAKDNYRKFVNKLHNLDPIKLAYLRTSFVFAISVLVTWTPSSINRVHSLLYPTSTSYSLNLASAVVLPLQGVWNAVIYCATTWTVLKEEVADFKSHWQWRWRIWRFGHDSDMERLGRQTRLNNGRRFRDMEPEGEEMSPTSPRPPGTMRVIRGGSL